MERKRQIQTIIMVGAIGFVVYGLWPVVEEFPAKDLIADISTQPPQPDKTPDIPLSVTQEIDERGEAPVTDRPSYPSDVAYDLSTSEGRQAYYDDLLQQPPEQIWFAWDDALSRGDPDEMGLVVPALGHALRRTDDSDLYDAIAERLYQPERPLPERLAILGVLEYAATPEALERLIAFMRDADQQFARSDDQDTLMRRAEQAIRGAARQFIDGQRNWAIAPVLEEAWRTMEASETPSALSAVAQSLGYLGTPEAIRALVHTASTDDAAPSTIKADLAQAAIQQIRANDAVPVLGRALRQHADDPQLSWVLLYGLVSVGSADAAFEIVNYLKLADSLDEAQLQRIETLLIERDLPEEALKVMATLLNEDQFPDPGSAQIVENVLYDHGQSK